MLPSGRDAVRVVGASFGSRTENYIDNPSDCTGTCQWLQDRYPGDRPVRWYTRAYLDAVNARDPDKPGAIAKVANSPAVSFDALCPR